VNQPCLAAAMVTALAIAAVVASPPARAQDCGAERCGADNGSLIVGYIADRVAKKLGPSLQGVQGGLPCAVIHSAIVS
jgi:hypothetical protein